MNEKSEASEAPAGTTPMSVVPIVILPMYLGIVDQTIVGTALPEIAARLGQVHYISWVVVGYLVAATIAAPVYGRLGDLYGRRILMLGALVVYAASSLICAAAPTMELLVLGRLLQGIGGGGLMTLSQALIGEAVPPRQRARLQGNLAAVSVTSNAFGPVLGGYLTQHFGWEAIFLVNLPIAAFAFAILLRYKGKPGHGERRPFDVLGLLLLSGFVASVLIGFSRGQGLGRDELVEAGFLLAAGTACLALLLRHESRTSYPLLPIKLLRQGVFWRADGLAACHGATFVSLITFVPIYLRVVRGVSLSETGLLLIPLTIGVGGGALLTGQAVSRTGRTAVFPSVGFACASILLVVIAVLGPRLDATIFSFLLGCCALFLGTVMAVVQVTVQSAATPRTLGAASSTVQLSRSIGAALGTGLVSLVLFATLAFTDSEAADLFRRLVQEGAQVMETLEPTTRLRLADEVGRAFVAAFLTIAGFSCIGTVLAWTMPMRRV